MVKTYANGLENMLLKWTSLIQPCVCVCVTRTLFSHSLLIIPEYIRIYQLPTVNRCAQFHSTSNALDYCRMFTEIPLVIHTHMHTFLKTNAILMLISDIEKYSIDCSW